MRDDLEELAVAERVARRLVEQHREETDRTPPAVGQVAVLTVLLVPRRERGKDEAALPEDYRRIMDAVRRADGPMMVKQVCTKLGASLEPARVEALRVKLKRLGERGWLCKLGDGKFTTTL
ncbi:hypothetical protein ACFY12_07030 [Streptomyces sp. NPDC001339]|uniref:hypothetical protein n=1 Tax=Streptomyces sp. NPDC001339 TaxID=3364563 RepID=UPI00369DF58C